MNNSVEDVIIAKVDADKHRDLGSRFGIKGFPTLKFFSKDGDIESPEDYKFGRDLDSLSNFISQKTKAGARSPKAPVSDVVVLTNDNFVEIVMDPSKHVLVEFYAPWCGHCKNLAPIYEQLASVFKQDEDVVIAKIDADEHKSVASRFGISGFPTLKFFPKGDSNKEAKEYTSGRAIEDFVEFINTNADTFRLPTGGLNELAGRLEDAEELIRDWFTAADDKKKAIYGSLHAKLSDQSSEIVAYYEKVIDKSAKNADFAEKEYNRMSKLISKGALIARDKLDSFEKKRNVLKFFKELHYSGKSEL